MRQEETELQQQIRQELGLPVHIVPNLGQAKKIYRLIGTEVDGSSVTIELHQHNYLDRLENQVLRIGYFSFEGTKLSVASRDSSKESPPRYFQKMDAFLEALATSIKQHGLPKLRWQDYCWQFRIYDVETCGTHWSVYTSYTYVWKFDLLDLTATYSAKTEVDASQ